MKKIFWVGFLFLFLVNTENIFGNEKFVTIVNPVRSRELWKDKTLSPIETQYEAINKLKLSATWLIQNDVLDDKELVSKIKTFDENQELGLFLEVSKNLAYRSRVYLSSTPFLGQVVCSFV